MGENGRPLSLQGTRHACSQLTLTDAHKTIEDEIQGLSEITHQMRDDMVYLIQRQRTHANSTSF